MPTQKAFEKAIKDNREGIELLCIISGRGDMDPKPAEDAAFLAMHLNYKGNWEFRAFSDEQINLMREMRKHSAVLQHYSNSPWDRLRGEKIFAQWPLKSYLPEMEKLQKLTRDYWRAREKADDTLETTKLVLGVKPTEALTVKYEGMAARRTTAGTIETETKAFTNLTNELEEMRKKPAVITAHKTNTMPSAVRYWRVKDSTVNVRGLEDKLDKLFSLFAGYLKKQGYIIIENQFLITDGLRSYRAQLFYIYLDYINGNKTYSSFTADFARSFSKIKNMYTRKNFDEVTKISEPNTNKVIIQLELEIELEAKNIGKTIDEVMKGNKYRFPHVKDRATDISIWIAETQSYTGLAIKMDEQNFKTEIEGLAAVLYHKIGGGTPHIHLTFQ